MASKKMEQPAEAKARDLRGERPQRLKGRIAVVTGSDSGMGQAIAIAFAKEGADVAIPVHRDRQGAERTREEIEKIGRRAFVDDLDQTDSAQVKRFFARVREELGQPNLLVNDAGVDSTGADVKDMSDEDWDREIRTNLYGPFYCCREFLRGLLGEKEAARKSGEKRDDSDVDPLSWTRGVIINVSSVHQEIPRAGAAGYDCSKGALRNLTRTLALELAEDRVRVVGIAPGMVLTPFNQKAIDDAEFRKKQVQSIPVKRAALPDEIARVAAFVASDEASYVHGTTIFVDGALMQFQGQGA